MTMVNHFLRIRANIAVLKTPGMIRKGKMDWYLIIAVVSPNIRKLWINLYCSCFYQYYRIPTLWCNLVSLNCKITHPPPRRKKKKWKSWLLDWYESTCALWKTVVRAVLCVTWFRNHSNTCMPGPFKHKLLVNKKYS